MEQETDFGWALDKMRDGYHVRRAGWNGKNQWVGLRGAEHGGEMTAPYLYLHNAQGDLVPWTPSQGDVLAYDWELT